MSQRSKHNSKEVLQDNRISSEEINSDNDEITEHDDNDQPANQQDLLQDTRPTHKAMMKARQRLKQWMLIGFPWRVSRITRINDITLLFDVCIKYDILVEQVKTKKCVNCS